MRNCDWPTLKPSDNHWKTGWRTEHRDYQPNSHQLSGEDEAKLRDAWANYYRHHGYPVEPDAS